MATATKSKTKTIPPAKRATIAVTGKALAAVLPRVAAVASARSAIQALGGVLLTSQSRTVLNLDATDMETSIRVPVRATGSTSFDALVDVKALQNVVKVLGPDEYAMTVSPAKGELSVSCGRKTMGLKLLRRVDFPDIDFTAGKPVMQSTGAQARAVFTAAEKYASHDETRPILTSISIDLAARKIVATDSYRLGIFDAPGLAPRRGLNVLVPARALLKTIAGKPGTFRLTYRDPKAGRGAHGIVQVDDATYAIRLVDGQYPNYMQLVPDAWEVTATVAARDLLDAAEFAKASLTHNCPLRIGVMGGLLQFSGYVPDKSSFETDVDADVKLGKLGPLEFGVNAEFMADAASTIEPKRGGKVTLQIISPLRPMVVTGRNGFALLMPIRLNV